MENERLIRIENKIDKIGDRLGAVDVTLAAQHESLKEHIRRTELLEEAIKPVTPVITVIKFLAEVIGVVAASGALYEIVKRLM